MREALIAMLQQRMDKTTNEQFWMVGAITALNAFLVAQADDVSTNLPDAMVIAVAALLAGYGVLFVVERHHAYYSLRNDVAELVQDEELAPRWLKSRPRRWRWPHASGVAFYVVWMTMTWLAVAATFA